MAAAVVVTSPLNNVGAADPPTVDLTTAMFAAYARDSSIGKAEALRRAQTAVRLRLQTAHPFFWAPFVLVGDGGASR